VHHTLREYFTPIHDAAAHVYHSALVTMPSCLLHELSSHETPADVVLRTPRRTDFAAEIMHMQFGLIETEAFALSSDGSQMACHEPDVVYLGSIDTGEMTTFNPPIEWPTRRILALHFSLDGHHLLCADHHGYLYDAEWRNGCLWTARSPAESINATLLRSLTASFSPSGSYCVFTLLGTLEHHASRPSMRQDRYLLVLRHVESGAKLQLVHDYDRYNDTSTPSNAAFTPDTQYVFQAYGSSIFVWDIIRQNLHTRISATNVGPDWSPFITRLTAVSNTVCASLSFSGTIALWDLIQGVHLRTITQGNVERSQHASGLACSSDGSLLAVVFENTMKVINVADSHIIAEHALPFARKTQFVDDASLGLDAAKSRLVVAGAGHPIFVWNFKSVNHTGHSSSAASSQGPVSCTAFSADGSLLVSGNEDGSMTIWRTDSGLPVSQHAGEGAVTAAALSAPYSKFVLSTRDFDVDPGLSVFQLSDRTTGDIASSRGTRPNPKVHAVTLSPDERYLALWLDGSPDDQKATSILWVLDTHTGKKTAFSGPSDGRDENAYYCTPRSKLGHQTASISFRPVLVSLRLGMHSPSMCASGCPTTMSWTTTLALRSRHPARFALLASVKTDPGYVSVSGVSNSERF
jgi:WD40 repeat protein